MKVIIHFCSRTGEFRFVREARNADDQAAALLALYEQPGTTFKADDGDAQFRIWAVDQSGEEIHFFALHAVALH